MMIIDNKYEIGEVVFLSTDEEQKRRLITGLRICPSGQIIYCLSCGVTVSDHYDFELLTEKTYAI